MHSPSPSGEGLFYGCMRLFVCFLHNLATTFLWHTAIVSKPKKLSKNLLTKGNCCAIICKLSTSGHENGGELRAKNTAKIFEKLFKNLLTNGWECGIIIKSRKTRLKRTKSSRGSLTIEQQEIKVQAKLVIENLEISLKKKSQIYHGFETYSTKYKEPNKLDKQGFNRKV